MHAKISASLGMKFPLEVFVLRIIWRPVRYDENRLCVCVWGDTFKTEINKNELVM